MIAIPQRPNPAVVGPAAINSMATSTGATSTGATSSIAASDSVPSGTAGGPLALQTALFERREKPAGGSGR
jgi:hypothetical protein